MVSRIQKAMNIIKESQGKKTSRVLQGTLHHPGTKVYFLDIAILVQNLGTWTKDCRAYHKDKYNGPRQSPRSNFARRSHDFLFMNKIECFNFHNIGHMARDCNLTWAPA